MSSPPPPRYSPDGRWWWDGTQWVPVQAPSPAGSQPGDTQPGEPAETTPHAPAAGDQGQPQQDAAPQQGAVPQQDPQAQQPQGQPWPAGTPGYATQRQQDQQVQQPQAWAQAAAQQAPAYDPRAQHPQWGAPAPGQAPWGQQVQRKEKRGLPAVAWIAIAVVAVIVVGAIGGGGWWYFTHRAQAVSEQQARQATQTAWRAATKAYSSGSPSSLSSGFDGTALSMMQAIVDDKAHRGLDEDAFAGALGIEHVFRSSGGGQFLVEGTATGGQEHAQLVMEYVGAQWKVTALDLETYSDFSPPRIKADTGGTYSPTDGGGLVVAPGELGAAYARYLTTGVHGSPSGPFADSQYTTKQIEDLKDSIARAAADEVTMAYAHRGSPPVKVFPMQAGALVVFGFDSARTDSVTSGCLSFNEPGGRFPSSQFKKAVLDYRGYAFATVPTSGKVTVEGLLQEAIKVDTTPC